VGCDSTQKAIICAGGGGRSAGSERRSGWEAIGGVFQLTRHWSGLPGGDRGEARVGLPPLNCAVSPTALCVPEPRVQSATFSVSSSDRCVAIVGLGP
jgi:hypothetical protein